MAVSFVESTSGTLFNRQSWLLKIEDWIRTHFREGGELATLFRQTEEKYVGGITSSAEVQPESDLLGDLQKIRDDFKKAAELASHRLANLSKKTLGRMLWADTGRFHGSARGNISLGPDAGVPPPDQQKLALQELVRQQIAASPDETLNACTVAATGAAGSTNEGNGTLVVSTIRGDGSTNELMMAEVIHLECVESGHDNVRLKYHEKFKYVGAGRKDMDSSHPDWGETNYGSACEGLMNVVDPTAYAERGTILTNGFADFGSGSTANTPLRWAVTTGTDGTDFEKSTTTYFGSNALRLKAGTGVLTGFRQVFNDQSYSPVQLKASTVYCALLRGKAVGTVTAGTLRRRIVNSAGTTIADDTLNSAVDLSEDIACTEFNGGSWVTKTVVWRTPRDVPSDAEFRFHLTVALTGSDVDFDSVAIGEMKEFYPGGPLAILFSGSTPFTSGQGQYQRDYFLVTVTNDSGGATHPRRNMHRGCDAMWDLKEHKVLLLTATSSETIPDSQITHPANDLLLADGTSFLQLSDNASSLQLGSQT